MPGLSLGRATIHAPIDVVVLGGSLILLFAVRAPTLRVLALAAGTRAVWLYRQERSKCGVQGSPVNGWGKL
jgi:hypothetical protein